MWFSVFGLFPVGLIGLGCGCGGRAEVNLTGRWHPGALPDSPASTPPSPERTFESSLGYAWMPLMERRKG